MSVRDQDNVSIYEVDPEADKFPAGYPIYVSPIRYPASLLPPLDLAVLSDCPDVPREGCTLPAFSLQYGIGDFQLSPDRQVLAWLDDLAYCGSSRCWGSGRIVTWNIRRQEKKVLLEYPYSIHASADQAVRNLKWSPDNRHLGYLLYSRILGWSRLHVIDLQTTVVTQIGEDPNVTQFYWSPTGDRVAYVALDDQKKPSVHIRQWDGSQGKIIKQDWVSGVQLDWSLDGQKLAVAARPAQSDAKWGIYLIDLQSGAMIQNTSISEKVEITAIKWAPDGNRIVLATQEVTEGMSNKPREKHIFVLNEHSGNLIQGDASDLWLDNPKWSPDSQVIAVNTYSPKDTMGSSNGIAILRASDGRANTQVSLQDAATDWIWSANSDALLMQLQDQQSPCSETNRPGIGLFYWKDRRLKTIPVFSGQNILPRIECPLQIGELTW